MNNSVQAQRPETQGADGVSPDLSLNPWESDVLMSKGRRRWMVSHLKQGDRNSPVFFSIWAFTDWTMSALIAESYLLYSGHQFKY